MAREIGDILADMVALVEEAFQAGEEAGQSKVWLEINRLASKAAPTAEMTRGQKPPAPRGLQVSDGQRAAAGTVKPRVLKLLHDHPEGLTTQEITALAGINPNSVRGTLWWLKKEDKVVQQEGRWFAGGVFG